MRRCVRIGKGVVRMVKHSGSREGCSEMEKALEREGEKERGREG